jgi:type I restriction enzyme S subunit
MTVETLIDNFDRFANLPDAIPKLRDLVLSLAAQGKLVEQRASDEPASVLAARIDEKLAAELGKRYSPIANIDIERLPKIPSTWVYAPLGNVAAYGSAIRTESNQIESEAWLLDLEDIEKDTSRLVQRKTYAQRPSKSTKTAFRAGDVLYGKLRPYLNKVVVADRPGYCTTEIVPIRTFGLIEPAYLCYALKRPEFVAYATRKSYGMNLPRLGTDDARRAPFPLPPLAEQKRIVAKVDELMALCDRLETQQKERDAKHAALARASLARFAEAPLPENLAYLFHPAYTIDPNEIRAVILNLAVQGKLVPQLANDEPPSKSFPAIKFENGPVPRGWAQAVFKDLTEFVTSGSRNWKKFYAKSGAYFIRTQNIKTDKLLFDDMAYVALPDSERVPRAQVKEGDILITITGANVTKAARVTVQPPEAYVSQHIALCRPTHREMSPYLHLCFISQSSARGKLETLAYGDKPGLNLNNIRDLILPIPPLAEQRRIVAKVEQLMATVDLLERHLFESRKMGKRLLEATVAKLTGYTALSKQPLGAQGSSRSIRRANSEVVMLTTSSLTIKQLRLKTDYRSLAPFVREFHPAEQRPAGANPICLVGLNGSGKSNLIEAIAEIFCFLELINLPWLKIES